MYSEWDQQSQIVGQLVYSECDQQSEIVVQ